MTQHGTLSRTPLHEEHVRLGAKLGAFAGYEMPIHYPPGMTAEHRAVREAAGLFDVSHMAEVEIRGPGALDFVQYLTTNDVDKLSPGQAQYSTLLRQDGGILDDLLVYRFEDRLMLVLNASNREKDVAWITRFATRFDVEVFDRSDGIALLALQGPRAESILASLMGIDLSSIGYYRFLEDEVAGRPAVISRTGYTGEDGFELYVGSEDARALWRRVLEGGASAGLVPAGLAARDSLRLEMGYALYGNDLDESHTPLEAGLGWIVKLESGEFVGREALVRQREAGIERRLVGFRLLERGFPRSGYPVHRDGRPIGEVTSGIASPSLGVGIGMGYLAIDATKPGTRVDVIIRDRPVPAEVVRPPFYSRGSLRS
jgi:aminomethyltransferase